MKKIRSAMLAVLTAMSTGLWFPGMVVADHLAAPTGLQCPVVGGVIEAEWDDLANATKYSVNVIATYDPLETPLDPTDDVSLDFDFGTSDRIDGDPISQPDLDIALSALEVDFGSGAIAPYDVQVRVKGLHSGKKQGRQNNPFSGLCDAV